MTVEVSGGYAAPGGLVRGFVLWTAIACRDEGTPTKTEPPGEPPRADSAAPTAETGLPEPQSFRLHEDVGSLAYALWEQPQDAELRVQYSFDLDEQGERLWLSSPARLFEAGPCEQILVGIPYETEAIWRLVDASTGEVVYESPQPILTGPRPPVPEARLVVSEPDRWMPDASWLLTSVNAEEGGWTSGSYWTILLDRKGRLVWAYETPEPAWTLFAQVARGGDHILWDEQRYWSDFGEGELSKVHRVWLDAPIEVIDTPGLHHAFVQLPDGTLVWGSKGHGGAEALVEKAPGQPDETVLWACATDWLVGDYWCESNGIFYVSATDSFLYSFYTNSTVIEIDHSGEMLWWAGDEPGGFGFDPPDHQYRWQHGVSYTDTGTLLVSSEHGSPIETWLLEYEVDREAQLLTLVWSNSSGTRAETNGQAWRLDNGNTLHIVGSAGVAREVDADGQDVWRVDLDGDYLLGQGELVRDLYALTRPVE